MNSSADVMNMISNWKTMGLTKAELVVKIAEACMEWPYVWGGAGQYCTPRNRESYSERPACPESEAKQIVKLCQVLSGRKGACAGCKWYPDSNTRFFDCRGFTRWVLGQVEISLAGAGATSQWNTESNWSQKGLIQDMPENTVCCLFMQNQKDHKTMEHTGFCIGGGQVIHCSGEVKRGKVTDRGWTHYAIPVGIDGTEPVPTPQKPTLRKGSTGTYVTLLQTMLIQRGYDLSPYGADGKFGAKTEAAVKEFQRVNGLKQDGICGKGTWAALESSEPTKLYTVTVQHLPFYKAEALKSQYTGAIMVEE